MIKEDAVSKLFKMELNEGIYFFVIIAYNDFGNISSNCINVTIEKFILNGVHDDDNSKGADELPSIDFGVIFFWIGTTILITVAIIVFVRYKRRDYWDIKWKRNRKNRVS